MRIVAVLCLAILLLVGCAPAGSVEPSAPSLDPLASAEDTTGGVPRHDPSFPAVDSAGRTPDDAVSALIEAANRGDWASLYSLYATPAPNIESATREWVEARETYEGFRVLEVRVVAPDAAFVRVSYRVTVAPMGSSSYDAKTEASGEWWPLHKVDGEWKTQWLPRQ